MDKMKTRMAQDRDGIREEREEIAQLLKDREEAKQSLDKLSGEYRHETRGIHSIVIDLRWKFLLVFVPAVVVVFAGCLRFRRRSQGRDDVTGIDETARMRERW